MDTRVAKIAEYKWLVDLIKVQDKFIRMMAVCMAGGGSVLGCWCVWSGCVCGGGGV